jgi:YD repeat-containing protein
VYDANGRLIRVETENDADPDPDHILHYAYDAQGRIETVATDSDGDGDIDALNTYHYLDGDNLVDRIDSDANNDGNVDVVTLRTYDAAGNLQTERLEANGVLLYQQEHTYDAQGRRTATETHNDDDGTAESTITYAYVC